MKLVDIIELLGHFGWSETEVRDELSKGDSAFNAFEGMKATLQFQWSEMQAKCDAAEIASLKPIYERIMRIKLKSAQRQSDRWKAADKQRASFVQDTMNRVEEQARDRLGVFFDALNRKKGD